MYLGVVEKVQEQLRDSLGMAREQDELEVLLQLNQAFDGLIS